MTARRMASWWIEMALSLAALAAAFVFFLAPAATIMAVLRDSQLRSTGQGRFVASWFRAAARRYGAWAADYEAAHRAEAVPFTHVAATEWPMFGSVFLLVTAADLQRQGLVDARDGSVRDAVERAASIVASPVTAAWVRTKWGETYLGVENVFYRMLLILGLSAYEEVTGDLRHRPMLSSQRTSLAAELAAAPLNLRDDYPGECYPSDVLWAVAAIRRAARLEGTDHAALAESLMAALDGPLRAAEGVPAFRVDSRSGRILQGARGCNNSGMLLFAPELDPAVAARWYDAHAACFWTNNVWLAGFRELPHGVAADFADVDSGPVLWTIGSVASAFGIGAARTHGRLDHAVPLTYEAVAASWPTPFGLLLPGLMGSLSAGSWSLGEIALLFSMTRPLPAGGAAPYTGPAPGSVWIALAAYLGIGLLWAARELRRLARLLRHGPVRSDAPPPVQGGDSTGPGDGGQR